MPTWIRKFQRMLHSALKWSIEKCDREGASTFVSLTCGEWGWNSLRVLVEKRRALPVTWLTYAERTCNCNVHSEASCLSFALSFVFFWDPFRWPPTARLQKSIQLMISLLEFYKIIEGSQYLTELFHEMGKI